MQARLPQTPRSPMYFCLGVAQRGRRRHGGGRQRVSFGDWLIAAASQLAASTRSAAQQTAQTPLAVHCTGATHTHRHTRATQTHDVSVLEVALHLGLEPGAHIFEDGVAAGVSLLLAAAQDVLHGRDGRRGSSEGRETAKRPAGPFAEADGLPIVRAPAPAAGQPARRQRCRQRVAPPRQDSSFPLLAGSLSFAPVPRPPPRTPPRAPSLPAPSPGR